MKYICYFKNFLLYLAVTDTDYIKICPKIEVYRQEIIGLSILLVTLCAAASGGYALHSVFNNQFVSVSWSLIWGLIVMTLDRNIISASFGSSDNLAFELGLLQKYVTPFFIRLPLAFLFGLIISIPLELRIFKQEIEQHISKTVAAQNQQKLANIKAEANKKKTDLAENSEREKDKHEQDVKKLENELTTILDRLSIEERKPLIIHNQIRGRNGRYYRHEEERASEAFRQLRNQYEAKRKELDKEQKTFLTYRNQAENDLKDKLSKIDTDEAAEVSKITVAFSADASADASLLTRYKALAQISDNDDVVKFFQLALRAMIILLEILPLILKIFSDIGPYDRILSFFDKQYRVVLKSR